MEGDSCQMEQEFRENNDENQQETEMTVYEVCELEDANNGGNYYSGSVSDQGGCSDSSIPAKTQDREKKGYYPQRYREAWEKLPEFKGWLRRSHINGKNPFCCACNCELIGGKSELQRHAKSSKHKRMLQTLSSEGLVAHPTVRVKGTENNYVPMQCVDTECSDIPAHIHCPLCMKKERAFQEPVALDIHFQEIHVEKSLDFGGLRILCCCLDCDICVPARGGDQSKKISGSHWHCFRCRRGFNRRSEANRHYRSHFKNPNATMEIHISQEVTVPQGSESEDGNNTIDMTDSLTNLVESILTTTAQANAPASQLVEAERISDTAAKNDQNKEMVMVLQSDESENTSQQNATLTEGQEIENSLADSITAKDKHFLEKVSLAFVGEIRKLKSQFTKVEQQLTSEVNQLKTLIQQQARELQELKQQQQQEYVSPSEGPLFQLFNTLRNQHTDMLRKQLQQVKQAAYAAAVRDIQGQQGTLKTTVMPTTNSTDSVSSSGEPSNPMLALMIEDGSSSSQQTFSVPPPSIAASETSGLPTSSPSSKPITVKNIRSGPTVISVRASVKEITK